MSSQPYGQMNPAYGSNGTPYSGKPGSYPPSAQQSLQSPTYGPQSRPANAPPYGNGQNPYMYQRQPGPGYNQMFPQNTNYPVSINY